MIIFGTRGITTTPDRGEFLCPECGGQREYAHRRVRRFFTLYFIPVIPLDKVGEYIECAGCQGTFKEQVLDHQSGPDAAINVEAEFQQVIKRVMALMTLADGEVDAAEIETMASIFGQLTNRQVAPQVLEDEVTRARTEGRTVADYLRGVSPMLNDHGKEMILRAAYMVAASDGVFHEDEMSLLEESAKALQMTPAHLQGILAEMRRPAE